jgi:hypothetical protein
MQINKIAAGIILSMITVSAVGAMEMMATDTMMKDKMVDTKMMFNDEMYMAITNKSKRDDVTKLQMMLVEKGYLKMPKMASYGYFGPLTSKAMMKYKDAKMMMKDDKMMSTGTMMKK